jgi:hypothetical protein
MIFWFILILISLPILRFGIKKRKWLLIIPGVTPITIASLILLSIAYRLYMASNSEWVFRQAFGIKPQENIKIIEKNYRFGTDFENVYLKFSINNKTLNELLGAQFKEITLSEFKDRLASLHPEQSFPLDASEVYYMASPYKTPHTLSEAILSFNASTGTVCFYGTFID